MDNKVLFICTGNYYRSRYAELFFNETAANMQVNWRAVSRGLAADEGHNEGPVSAHASRRLTLRGISTGAPVRFPLQLEEKDLLEADPSAPKAMSRAATGANCTRAGRSTCRMVQSQ
ncbi:MAG: hypothetical protein ACOYYJ_06225 [Chloroflexota bacterium]